MTEQQPVLAVPDSAVKDLRDRLRRTRWALPWPIDGWDAGVDAAVLHRLVDHWTGPYNWRDHEAMINALPSHTATIGRQTIHYLRFEAERPGALPILLANGWPSSFLELIGLARRLSTPSEYCGSSDDAFTVIIPSLPGYGLSEQRPQLGGPPFTHDILHALMHDVLGFDRYAAHGSDIGAGDVSLLAQAYPEAVTGVHLLDAAKPPKWDPAGLTDEERAYLDAEEEWARTERGYSHEQETKPLTLAYGLSDSPTGLLAWIVEKYRRWSDCGGDVSARFSDDFLLTQASLYWFTNTISTSFRPYYERKNGLVPPVVKVRVPTAVALFPADLGGRPPAGWVKRTYDLVRYTIMPRGGHFAAHEEPDLLAEDIRRFFGHDLSN
jgi:pimeloyl-ACP methyl ester carboxylesterase